MFFFSNFTKNGILLPGIILNELYFSFYRFFCELKLFRIKILNNIYDTGVINLSRFEEKWKIAYRVFILPRLLFFLKMATSLPRSRVHLITGITIHNCPTCSSIALDLSLSLFVFIHAFKSLATCRVVI